MAGRRERVRSRPALAQHPLARWHRKQSGRSEELVVIRTDYRVECEAMARGLELRCEGGVLYSHLLQYLSHASDSP